MSRSSSRLNTTDNFVALSLAETPAGAQPGPFPFVTRVESNEMNVLSVSERTPRGLPPGPFPYVERISIDMGEDHEPFEEPVQSPYPNLDELRRLRQQLADDLKHTTTALGRVPVISGMKPQVRKDVIIIEKEILKDYEDQKGDKPSEGREGKKPPKLDLAMTVTQGQGDVPSAAYRQKYPTMRIKIYEASS